MTRLALILVAFVVASACAQAQPRPGPNPPPCGGPDLPPCGPYQPPPPPQQPRWSPGDRFPPSWQQDEYAVPDWRGRNLPPPPRGYRWYCSTPRNCFLVRKSTGIVVRTRWNDEREEYWRRRYAQRYSYQDDIYWRECRSRPDPAGILIGGLIGGLIGSAADHHDAGALFAGVIAVERTGLRRPILRLSGFLCRPEWMAGRQHPRMAKPAQRAPRPVPRAQLLL
jgi:hypothetical protein